MMSSRYYQCIPLKNRIRSRGSIINIESPYHSPIQSSLEFPAGILCTYDRFALHSWDTTFLCSCLYLALRLGLFLSFWQCNFILLDKNCKFALLDLSYSITRIYTQYGTHFCSTVILMKLGTLGKTNLWQ